MARTSATTKPISHIDALGPEDFTSRYADLSIPVVLSGVAERWPALGKWSHSWFAEKFRTRAVRVTFGGPLGGHQETMTLGEYLDGIARLPEGSPLSGSAQPYLRLEPLPGVLPELQEDFTVPSYCPPGRSIAVHIWIGPRGTVQPFHRDNQNPFAAVHNLLVQVQGRMLVRLVSADQDQRMYRYPADSAHANYSQVDPLCPDLDRFPLFREAEIAEAVVRPGEAIFIPAGTWHHVQSLEPSISLSFWWYRTVIADVVAALTSLADDSARHLGSAKPKSLIDVQDVDEFGGIWALALAARTLPAGRYPLLAGACTEPVALALREALDRLNRKP